MRYVILGGGGSFGLHTARYLLDHGAERVVSIGRNPPKLPCFTLGIGDGDKRYSYHALHLNTELDMVLEVIDRGPPDIIVNFAAQGEGATSFHHSWRYFETNCVAMVKLAEELQRRDRRERFIHISTSELYGPTRSTQPRATEISPILPTSPYAVSKAAFDQYLHCLPHVYKFPYVVLRPSNCYGEGQQLHRLIPKAVLFGLTGRKLPLHGGGAAQKSYMHNEDLARAIHLVSEASAPDFVYNVGPEKPTAVRSVVEMVARQLNIGFEDLCTVTEDREHQDARYWLDSSRLREDMSWQPRINWETGIARMVQWGRDNLEQLRQLPTEFVMRA